METSMERGVDGRGEQDDDDGDSSEMEDEEEEQGESDMMLVVDDDTVDFDVEGEVVLEKVVRIADQSTRAVKLLMIAFDLKIK